MARQEAGMPSSPLLVRQSNRLLASGTCVSAGVDLSDIRKHSNGAVRFVCLCRYSLEYISPRGQKVPVLGLIRYRICEYSNWLNYRQSTKHCRCDFMLHHWRFRLCFCNLQGLYINFPRKGGLSFTSSVSESAGSLILFL
jgi:hypothetical protein